MARILCQRCGKKPAAKYFIPDAEDLALMEFICHSCYRTRVAQAEREINDLAEAPIDPDAWAEEEDEE